MYLFTTKHAEECEESTGRWRRLCKVGEHIGHEDGTPAVEAKDEEEGGPPNRFCEQTPLIQQAECHQYQGQDDQVEEEVPDQIGQPEGDRMDTSHDLDLED